MAYRFSDTFNKYGIKTKEIDVFAKSTSKIKVDAVCVLLPNYAYTNGALKVLKGSKCHIQNLTVSKVEPKYVKCSDELRKEIKERITKEYSFYITLNEDIIIYSLSIATNFVFGSEKSEWSDRFTVTKTGRKLGEYFICKYTYPTEENLQRIRNFWNRHDTDNMVKEAEHSLTSDKASSLSEEAKQQSEEIAKRVYEDNKAKEEEELREKSKSFIYEFSHSEPYIDKVLEYNNSKLEIALFNLDVYNTLYLTGLSRSGKTYLCREVSGKYCNIDTSKFGNGEYYFSNLMWVPCYIDRKYFIRKFAEFCVHNLNSEKCLLVLNEATKEALYRLLPIWEDMDRDGKKFKELIEEGLAFECDGTTIEIPKGLRILANVADGQDKNDIDQVVNRFVAHIDMNMLTDDISLISQYVGIKEDIIKLLYNIQDGIIKEYSMDKTFLVIYRLKYDKRKYLEEIYNNQCNKLFGPKWKEAKETLREYIDNEL